MKTAPWSICPPINERPPPATDAQRAIAVELIGDAHVWYHQYGDRPDDLPELNIRRAMLTQAWNDLHNPGRYPSVSRLERYKLMAWLEGQYPFGAPYRAAPGYSFVEVCDALGLEPRQTRQAMLERKPPAHNSIREYIVLDMMHIKQVGTRSDRLRKKNHRAENRPENGSGTERGGTSQTPRPARNDRHRTKAPREVRPVEAVPASKARP